MLSGRSVSYRVGSRGGNRASPASQPRNSPRCGGSRRSVNSATPPNQLDAAERAAVDGLAFEDHVKRRDEFWLKSQPYSLRDMLADDATAEEFLGVTVPYDYLITA
jgi:hypothetical protein